MSMAEITGIDQWDRIAAGHGGRRGEEKEEESHDKERKSTRNRTIKSTTYVMYLFVRCFVLLHYILYRVVLLTSTEFWQKYLWPH